MHAPATLRSGSTLLLAMVILGSLVSTSLAIGALVLVRLRNVRAIDQGIIASYAAESGVEELLYRVRHLGQVEALDVPATAPMVFANGSSWWRTVTATIPELTTSLVKDAVEQVDLFDPGGAFRPVGIASLRIAIARPQPDAWLEVSWSPWLASGAWAPVQGHVLYGPSELATERVVDLAAPMTDAAPIAYRVRIRAIGADLGTIRIRGASDRTGNTIVPLPSRVRGTVVGRLGDTQHATRVDVPPRLPLAPVFDYVLFSECDIVKGDTVNCP